MPFTSAVRPGTRFRAGGAAVLRTELAPMPFRKLLPLLVLLSATAAFAGVAPRSPIPDFTFVHCSDIHVPPGVTRKTGPAGGPQFGSAEVVAQIKTLAAPIELKPYRVTVPAPSFSIATGDLTEFGGLNGWWDQYLELWRGAPFPTYHVSGNHDSTWASQRYQIRKLHGGAFYSFDYANCHFIGWDSASVQDPRPSFGEEELNWLRRDLKRISKSTPVFLYCHHPIDSGELASLHERDRLLDVLRPYNLALLVVGHGHRVQHRVVAGVDQVMGGSTFGDAPGYSIVSVKDGILRVAYRRGWQAVPEQPVLEKPLPLRSDYPTIRIREPRDGATLEGPMARFRVTVDRRDLTAGSWTADDEKGRAGELVRRGDTWQAEVDTRDWEPGAHYVRFTFQAPGGRSYQKTTRLYTADPERRILWRAQLRGSGRGTPAVDGGLLLVPGQDGVLYALDRATGKQRWTFRTGGEILARPLPHDGRIYFGSGDTRFYCLDRRGRLLWSREIGHPVYSGAAVAADRIIVAANNGRVYAFNAAGDRVWECAVPQYSIESRPWVSHDQSRVIYGSWDGYVYCLDPKDGAVKWRTQGVGSKAALPGVARYYAPADAAPVQVGNRIWVADRAFRLSILNAATGEVISDDREVSSTALSEDGQSVYLRGSTGNLRKVSAGGATIWSVPARTNVLPSAPVERSGIVYSATPTGMLIAFEAATGQQLWSYQCTPRLYVFADPVADGERVYVCGMDGSVTALRARQAQR